MKIVKKSFNMSGALAQRIDDFIQANPGVSLTWLLNQAVINWLQNPQVTLRNPKAFGPDEVDRLMEDNRELMDDLAK